MILTHHRARRPSRRKLHFFTVSALLTQLAACAHRPVAEDPGIAMQYSNEVLNCGALIASASETVGDELDASNIRVFNWNVQKTREAGWRDDFETIAGEAHLVMFQEASLREETIAEVDASRHWSFAPGYRRWGEVTGVMTLSSIKPLTQCSFVHYEPLLGTPKATGVTQYALTGTDETLIVVNVHAVNFSLGLGAFDEQFAEISDLLTLHSGPVILSGDFNTWRPKRTRIVESLASEHGLTPVDFANDHRVRFLGNVLDHIYVRGLDPVAANTEVVETSDHNPMSADFRM